MMPGEAVRLRLSESRLRIALSVATPPLLLAAAWGSWAVDASVFLTALLALLTAGLGYVAAFDFPIAVDVDSSGIHRICLLRRQLVAWDDIAAIVQPRNRGLIVVTEDRKRHILLDRFLEAGELDLLRAQAQLRDVKIEF